MRNEGATQAVVTETENLYTVIVQTKQGNSMGVGEALVVHDVLDLAVLNAVEISPDQAAAVSKVALGLVMAGAVEWTSTKHPRLHQALGRIVITDQDGIHRRLYQRRDKRDA